VFACKVLRMNSILPSYRIFLLWCIGLLLTVTASGQINLGTAINYSLFTGGGEITNTGNSSFTGNIASNLGPVAGFEPPTQLNGSIIPPGSTTESVKTDLVEACLQLRALSATTIEHDAIFGNGETILPGVHFTTVAGSLNGSLTLDAQGNSNSVFVFRVAGAFNTAALSSITLINQAKAANVYFIVSGEIIIAAGSSVAGTWIANDGAASLGAGSIMEGRLMSVVGAIMVEASTIAIPENILLSARTVLAFTAKPNANGTTIEWLTEPQSHFTQHDVERSGSEMIFQQIATFPGGDQANRISFRWLDPHVSQGSSYYRLKSISSGNNPQYSSVIKVIGAVRAGFKVYPNPVINGRISISFKGRAVGVYSVNVYTLNGVLSQSTNLKYPGGNGTETVSITTATALKGGYLTIRDPNGSIETFTLLVSQ
jgi:hypothetical protein